MTQDLEHRATRGLDLKPGASTGDFKSIGRLVGYAAVFNSDSETLQGPKGPFIERIAPGAFTRTLRESPGVLALWQHETNSPLARAPHGGLSLSEDEVGLQVAISLPATSLARDALELVRAKIVDAMSFGFRAVRDSWSTAKGIAVRTLHDVDLIEVSPVTWAAYAATTLDARARRATTATADDLHEIERQASRFGILRASGADRYEAEINLARLKFGLPRIP
jgi:HK97 family phage prohead protease